MCIEAPETGKCSKFLNTHISWILDMMRMENIKKFEVFIENFIEQKKWNFKRDFLKVIVLLNLTFWNYAYCSMLKIFNNAQQTIKNKLNDFPSLQCFIQWI